MLAMGPSLTVAQIIAPLRNARLVMMVLALGLVGLVSSADSKRNAVVWILLAFVLAAVLMLIADLDRSQGGLHKVSQQALWDLQRQFAVPAP